ncbi:C-terminal binding protein [Saccharopolyspora hattusasensis]|uniref:C-terminal binding protein n=1 Tax=Saccharopolyspora hattusasensis TaxID=1128679 RepID=UPI003D996E21
MTDQNLSAPVVVTDSDHPNLDPEHSVLDPAGIGLRRAQCRTAEDVIAQCGGAQVLVNQYAPITAEVLDALPDVRLVVRYGVGVETVDVDAATSRGVWVANVPDYGTTEVADHTMALAMALLRGVAGYDRSVRAGVWDYQVARPLHRLDTRTFGVVGCGTIGQAVAARAAAFGMRVLGFEAMQDRSLAGTPITRVGLDELLASSDVISLHATLDSRSARLIDARALASMRDSAVLVNTARGGLVDTPALLAALDAGQIAGAALDVLDSEPIDVAVRDALARHERVVLSPHAAWYSEESFVRLKSEVAREAVRVLAGRSPRCPVNSPVVGGVTEASPTEVPR